jgi:hypothetical protein
MKIKYKDMKVKRNYLLLSFSIMLFSAGCGYNVGNISNPQIKTIALAPIKNECVLPNMSEYMRNALSEAFEVDGSYDIKNMYTADCILYGRISDAEVTAVDIRSSTGGTTFVTREFNMAITFEFTVVIPGQANALVPTTSVQGNAQYSVPVDQFVAQQNGIKQASWDAANKVVWSCTESW